MACGPILVRRFKLSRFLDDTNANPKPFTWTKDPNKIIAAVKRGHQSLQFDPTSPHYAAK